MKIEKTLTTPTREWTFTDLDESEQFATDLLESITDTPYYGISANECGSDFRVLALKADPESFVCFNPRIVLKSPETNVLEEVSASFKGITCRVRRHIQIRARFIGPDGQTYSKTFTGLTARIFQQLLNNLDGVPFYNTANLYHRTKALRKVNN